MLIFVSSVSLSKRLLDILSGRKSPRCDSGPILIEGQKQPRNFKLIAGYVKQVSLRKSSIVTISLGNEQLGGHLRTTSVF